MRSDELISFTSRLRKTRQEGNMGPRTLWNCLRAWSVLVGAVLAVILFTPQPASAQVTTTINQTSCANGSGSCLNANGFLQDLVVDCAQPGAAGKISTALASIADRNGPNR